MKIQKIEKINDGLLTQNQCCKELEGQCFCIHNDKEKKLIFSVKKEVNRQFYIFPLEVKYCPYCGFSYQPERLNPEASEKEDAIV